MLDEVLVSWCLRQDRLLDPRIRLGWICWSELRLHFQASFALHRTAWNSLIVHGRARVCNLLGDIGRDLPPLVLWVITAFGSYVFKFPRHKHLGMPRPRIRPKSVSTAPLLRLETN